jgi:hypothetical protein
MTTLDDLLINYTLEEEYYINECECPCTRNNKYDIFSGEDVIFQFTIQANYVKDAFIIFQGSQVPVVPKQIQIDGWVICLKFPSIAISALCRGEDIYLYLPGAVNVESVVSLSKCFISKDRSIVVNVLQSFRKISFALNGQTCTIIDSH